MRMGPSPVKSHHIRQRLDDLVAPNRCATRIAKDSRVYSSISTSSRNVRKQDPSFSHNRARGFC